MSRAGTFVLVPAGLLIAIAPALTWFTSPLPEGTVTARGVPAAGELWALVPLGLAVLVFGAAIGRSPMASPAVLWCAVGATLAGLLAVGVGVAAAAVRPAVLVVDQAGREAATGAPVNVALTGPVVVFAGAGLAIAAGATLLSRSRRAKGS